MIRALEMTDLPWVRALYADFLAETSPKYPRFGPQALDRFVLVLPKVIPGEFTQVFMWAIPADQDPRVSKP